MTRLTPELQKSDRRYDVRDQKLAVLIQQFLEELEGYENPDLIRELLVTAAKLGEQKARRGDVKILRAAAKEMRYAFKLFDQYRDAPKVTIFGSARTGPDHPNYQITVALGRELSSRGCMTITGAGGGIMEAGNCGAGREHSFGLNILLPFEQVANQFIAGDRKLINFHYFFTRKLFFVKESDAIVLLPGGFGTMDECFESLTLVQTGKDDPTPIVMLEHPDGTYWTRWKEFVQDNLIEGGLASSDDLHLFRITNSVEVACDEILGFYRRYHSSRYVNRKQTLVLRLREELPADRLTTLNRGFADILTPGGRIERVGPAEEEKDEPALADAPRLAVPFDQKHFGRLRMLIDAINR